MPAARRLHPAIRLAASLALLLPLAVAAQAPSAAVFRCGNTYSSTPCPGAKAVQADDPRSEAQRQQALAVKSQDAQLANNLAAERQARERASAGQAAARIGPTEAERARAEALAAKKAKAEHGKDKPRKKKSRSDKLRNA